MNGSSFEIVNHWVYGHGLSKCSIQIDGLINKLIKLAGCATRLCQMCALFEYDSNTPLNHTILFTIDYTFFISITRLQYLYLEC